MINQTQLIPTRICFFTTTRFHAFPIKILRYLQCGNFARSSKFAFGWYLVFGTFGLCLVSGYFEVAAQKFNLHGCQMCDSCIIPPLRLPSKFANSEISCRNINQIAPTCIQTSLNMPLTETSYGRQSADRTKPHFDVIFFVFLSTFFGNLDVCYAKTCNIF